MNHHHASAVILMDQQHISGVEYQMKAAQVQFNQEGIFRETADALMRCGVDCMDT